MSDQINNQVNTELLNRGTMEVIDRVHLAARLSVGVRLRVKLGIDPSGTDLHLGHAVVLRKLRQFQRAGHTVVLIIGDWTARIGDPSGKKEARPQLTSAQVKENAKKYLDQIALILDLKKTEVRWQSEWFDSFTLQTIIELAAKFTVQRLLEREDFKTRMREGIEVRYHEPLYCLLQGYDSVPIKADLEIGGKDQLFNLLKGRDVQEMYGLVPQDVMTVPLLIGLDGKDKMGKSLNNYIALADAPSVMFGKVMSLPDSLIIDYFTLATDVSLDEIKMIERELKEERSNPRDSKARLAFEIVTLYHGRDKATAASQDFDRVFRDHEMPADIPEVRLNSSMIRPDVLVVSLRFAPSKAEAQRIISQGGLKIAGTTITDGKKEIYLMNDDVVQVGKRKFAKVKID